MNFAEKVKQIPIGSSKVVYKNEKYLLTKEILARGKVIKIFARSLESADFISFNYYILKKGDDLKPCEMSMKKVTDFVLAI